MKSFNRIFAAVILGIMLIFTLSNIYLQSNGDSSGRPYRVEINRIAEEIRQNGFENIDLLDYEYVTGIERSDGSDSFFDGGSSDYAVREINVEIYRFDYIIDPSKSDSAIIIRVNIILAVMSALILAVMFFIKLKILRPFESFRDIPYELSKGNLTVPVKESKNRFFGKFLWGVDLLRENMEEQKKRELDLQRDKKTLILSVSHDIKTPLSAIKLYSKALSKGLYKDKEKQLEIAESINEKADEIEEFLSEIISASRDDFLNLEVNCGEFYLSELVSKISVYYREKLSLVHTDFSVGHYCDCILKGDFDRSIEVLQNVIENAVKYGNGHKIEISFSEEDGCQLITVRNSGCTLPETELPHIFDSFWRGSNAEKSQGSGLGLYICRQLMRKMNGEIFAEIQNEYMNVSAVFLKA